MKVTAAVLAKLSVMGAMPISLQVNADVNSVMANQPRSSVSKAAKPDIAAGNADPAKKPKGMIATASAGGTLPAPKSTAPPQINPIKQTTASSAKAAPTASSPGTGPSAPAATQQALNDTAADGVLPTSNAASGSMPMITTASAKLAYLLLRKTALTEGCSTDDVPVYRNDMPRNQNPATLPMQEKAESGLMAAKNTVSALARAPSDRR